MKTYKLNRRNRNQFFKFSQITLMSVCTLFLMRAAEADCTQMAVGDQVVLNSDVTLHAGVRAIRFGTITSDGLNSGVIDFSRPGLPGDIPSLMKEYVIRKGLVMTYTGDSDSRQTERKRYRFSTNRQISGFFEASYEIVCREYFDSIAFTVIPATPTPINGTSFDPSAVVIDGSDAVQSQQAEVAI